MTSFHLGNEYVVLGVVWVDLLGASETVIHDCKTIGLSINIIISDVQGWGGAGPTLPVRSLRG